MPDTILRRTILIGSMLSAPQSFRHRPESLYLGVVSFLDHTWSDRFTSSFGYSLENIENSNGELASDFHQGHYAIANLLFHPISKVTMGGEFQFGRRLNFNDGFNVNDYRVQFSFKYDWGKTFEF